MVADLTHLGHGFGQVSVPCSRLALEISMGSLKTARWTQPIQCSVWSFSQVWWRTPGIPAAQETGRRIINSRPVSKGVGMPLSGIAPWIQYVINTHTRQSSRNIVLVFHNITILRKFQSTQERLPSLSRGRNAVYTRLLISDYRCGKMLTVIIRGLRTVTCFSEDDTR